MPRSKKIVSSAFKQQVAKAKKLLLDAERPLPIDGDPIPPAEGRSLRGAAFISAEALAATAEILGTHGSMFPTFSASDASEAHTYEIAMRDLSSTAKAFARRIDRSILRRRVGPINNTLALYAAVKAVGRTDEKLDETSRRLGKLITAGRKGRSTKKAGAADATPSTSPPSPPATKITGTTPIIVSIDSGAPVTTNGASGAPPAPNGAASGASNGAPPPH